MNPVDAVLSGPTNDTETFLSTYKPSSNRQDILGGWYWVINKDGNKGPEKPAEGVESTGRATFEQEGAVLEAELSAECRRIKDEAPVRANKKLGIKSQKELREAAHETFNADVKELAQKHGVLSGKWLLYPGPEGVDSTWAKVVNALAKADGALARTGSVHCAKVSSAVQPGGSGGYVICVYCDDSWDEKGVKAAFLALVKDLGLVSSAYKCDANTILGIDSKHPSKVKSSMYGKNDFMSKEEIDAAFAAREADPSTASKAKAVKPKTLEEEEAEGGGFAPVSDSEDDEPPNKKVKI